MGMRKLIGEKVPPRDPNIPIVTALFIRRIRLIVSFFWWQVSLRILAIGSMVNSAASKFESSTDGKFLNSVWVSFRGQELDRWSEFRSLVTDSARLVLFSIQASQRLLGLNINPSSLNTTKCCWS
jgi:hypothetical protein